MIAQNEPNAYAAEVPFFLPALSNPTTGVTGVTFTLGQVQYRLPSGSSWTNATLVSIIEKGFGRYAYRLTAPGQTGTAGIVYLRATGISGTQPAFVTEGISELGGDIPVNGDGYLPFYLPDATNPVFNTGITGHSFATGEVKICLPNGAYANANLANVVELGFGTYALLIKAADGATTLAGKAYIHVDIGASSQPFDDFRTILGVGGGVSPTPPVPTPVVPSGTTGYTISQFDHVAGGILRLCQQFRFEKTT